MQDRGRTDDKGRRGREEENASLLGRFSGIKGRNGVHRKPRKGVGKGWRRVDSRRRIRIGWMDSRVFFSSNGARTREARSHLAVDFDLSTNMAAVISSLRGRGTCDTIVVASGVAQTRNADSSGVLCTP